MNKKTLLHWRVAINSYKELYDAYTKFIELSFEINKSLYLKYGYDEDKCDKDKSFLVGGKKMFLASMPMYEIFLNYVTEIYKKLEL